VVSESLVDLGVQPLSNAYVPREMSDVAEAFYPLHPMVCERCFFVQLGVFASPEKIFGDYAYFSSTRRRGSEALRRGTCAVGRPARAR